MNSEKLKNVLHASVSRILTPLIRILLRNGVSVDAFVEISKQVFVNVTEKDLAIPGKEQTTARIATLTGLSRKEVLRLRSIKDNGQRLALEHHNRASRVISAWAREPEFHDKPGHPVALPFDGEQKSFTTLVKKYSGDITARTILEELIHSGAVSMLKDGRIKLVTNTYIPKSNDVEKVKILGTDVTDLIAAIDHNLSCPPEDVFFQRKVWYDNIPEEYIKKVKKQIVKKGQTAIENIDREMTKYDRDSNPDIKGKGRKRAMIGIYYYEEDWGGKE